MEIIKKYFILTACYILSFFVTQAKVSFSMSGTYGDMAAQEAIFVLKNIADETYYKMIQNDYSLLRLHFCISNSGTIISPGRNFYRGEKDWINHLSDIIYDDMISSTDFEWIIIIPLWLKERWGPKSPIFADNRDGYLQFFEFCRKRKKPLFPFIKESWFPYNLQVSELYRFYCQHIASPIPSRLDILDELTQRKWPGSTSSDFDISQEDITNAFSW